MKIVFATQNRSKVREASEILGPSFELVIPSDLGITEDIPENGDTLEENSLQKALYVYERTGEACFSDDSGLEVDALGGAPGVHTARYAGESRSAEANIDKLLRELGDSQFRTARFRTCATLVLPGISPRASLGRDDRRALGREVKIVQFEGVMPGRIARERSGCGGFGYDPVFIPDEADGRTAAELSEEEKNAISHRGKALRALAAFLINCQ